MALSFLKTLSASTFFSNKRYLFSCSFSTRAIALKTEAISGNPSSSAILAASGYKTVYSRFSPAAATRRFSDVLPIMPAGKVAVISTSPPSRNLKNLLACSFSLSAVSVKNHDICSYPYFFAWEAKYVYLFLACDSPAKEASRFFSVFVPFILFMLFTSPFLLY